MVKPRDDRDETDPRGNDTEDVFRSTLAISEVVENIKSLSIMFATMRIFNVIKKIII